MLIYCFNLFGSAEIFNFDEVDVIIFIFGGFYFPVLSWKSMATSILWTYSVTCFPRSVMGFNFIFRSMIHVCLWNEMGYRLPHVFLDGYLLFQQYDRRCDCVLQSTLSVDLVVHPHANTICLVALSWKHTVLILHICFSFSRLFSSLCIPYLSL